MVKKYRIKGLDCANCARELEEKLNKVEGMNKCKINFIMEKISIDSNDEIFNEVLAKAKKIALSFEDGVEIIDD